MDVVTDETEWSVAGIFKREWGEEIRVAPTGEIRVGVDNVVRLTPEVSSPNGALLKLRDMIRTDLLLHEKKASKARRRLSAIDQALMSRLVDGSTR